MQPVEIPKSPAEQAIRNIEPSRVRHPLVATVATVLPPALVLGLNALHGHMTGSWLLLLVAVVVSARWGGYANGIVATLVSAGIMWWSFIPPEHVLIKPVGLRYLAAVTFVTLGVVLSALIRRAHSGAVELVANQIFLQSVLDYSPNGVAIKDLEGHYLVVNKGFEAVAGVKPEAALRHTDDDLFAHEFVEAMRAAEKRVKETNAPALFEKSVDGDNERILMVSVYPLHGASGSLFATGATLVDITQGKRGERALQDAMEDLRTAQHVAHVGSWRWDFRTNKATWSEELYRIFGIDTSESAIPIVNPGRKLMTAESIDKLQAAIEKLRVDGQPYEVDLEFTRPDGEARWATARGEAIRDNEGTITGVSGTAADVTHIKELERLRDEWMSIIAHDLRQPISAISAASDFLPELLQRPTEQGRELLRRIHSSADNLKRMVDDLLDVSLVEAHRLTLERKPTDPGPLVRETVARLAGSSRARIDVRERGPMRSILVDPMRIEQVVGNVLANAMKYGEPDAAIDVQLEFDERGLTIAIANRGRGLQPDEIPRIFDRFTRTKTARESSTQGVGLGLYICKGIVEAHGGRIWVESVPGKTTTFYIAIPASAARQAA